MPRVQPQAKGRRPFKPGELVRAISAAYVSASDGDHFIHTGDTYSADSEVVKAIPETFIPADLPSSEIAGWLPALRLPEPERDPRLLISAPPEIPAERKVICLESLGDFTEQIAKGQVVDAKHRFVKQWPSYFSSYRPLTLEDVERLTA
jgi:hypothetical protein